MDRHAPDDAIDGTIARFLAVRGDAIVEAARPASVVASHLAIAVRPHSRDRTRVTVALVLAGLLTALLLGAGLLVGGGRHIDDSSVIVPVTSPSPAVVSSPTPTPTATPTSTTTPAPTTTPLAKGTPLGTFTATGSMSTPREQSSATLLSDGRVLVVGGYYPSVIGLTSAEVWDPATGTFSPAGQLTYGRWGHRAELLADGRVLVSGGMGPIPDDPKWLDGAHQRTFRQGPVYVLEIWDPATSAFSIVESRSRLLIPADPPKSPGSLPDGHHLLDLDPADENARVATIIDPDDGSRAYAGTTIGHRSPLQSTVVTLADGRVLIVGGSVLRGSDASTAEIFALN